eukprot:TRINITY_DN1386_c0_g1_i2.p1 TRINITY_DN1386_c0_g1~~TRINITY_DN1386_c0_g1_i2.p1  ORF type:complete len:348 (-),score=78.56 TRINITY_DN1386_c0_g1_i2:48-1091(-)
MLFKFSKLLKGHASKHQVVSQKEEALATMFNVFLDRDTVEPTPFHIQDNPFPLAMSKFAEIFNDVSLNNVKMLEGTNDLANELDEWNQQELIDNVKQLQKLYSSASSDYEKALNKVASLQQGNKVSKLYFAEIERSDTEREYKEATYNFELYLSNLKTRINFELTRTILTWLVNLGTGWGTAFTQIDQIREYLHSLQEWALCEMTTLEEHQQEKAQAREQEYAQIEEMKYTNILNSFDTNIIQKICEALTETHNSSYIVPMFVSLYEEYGSEMPEGLKEYSDLVKGNVPQNFAMTDALGQIQALIRDNLPVIGAKFGEEMMKNEIMAITESLSRLEKPSSTGNEEEQ